MVAPRAAGLGVEDSALAGAAGNGLFPTSGAEGVWEAPSPASCRGFGFVYLTSGVTFTPACTPVTTSSTNAEMGPGELHMLAAVGKDKYRNKSLRSTLCVQTFPKKPTYPATAVSFLALLFASLLLYFFFFFNSR